MVLGADWIKSWETFAVNFRIAPQQLTLLRFQFSTDGERLWALQNPFRQ
jgi:hypothetical protein